MARHHNYAICPKCLQYCQLTHHHIFPQTYFGRGKKNNHTILLCRSCHDEADELINCRKKPKEFYTKTINDFLRREYVPNMQLRKRNTLAIAR